MPKQYGLDGVRVVIESGGNVRSSFPEGGPNAYAWDRKVNIVFRMVRTDILG